jgi:hypothetical protein
MAALAALVVLSRRLSDRIRELCTQAANAGDANFAEVLSELQSALHEPAARAREMGIRQIAGRKERRLRKTFRAVRTLRKTTLRISPAKHGHRREGQR